MIYYGEVRIYTGGRMELYAQDDVFVPKWIPGETVIAKGRYQNKSERRRIIGKAKEVFGDDIEIGIIPDCVGEQEEDE